MVSEERDSEIMARLQKGVIEFDEDLVREASHEALEEGVDAYHAIMDGLAAGMDVVGELFSSKEYFVPEVLMCADALNVGSDILRPHVVRGEKSRVVGEVVIGTVEGDVHDIGKNLVKMMFEIAGFTVHDLGRDVPLDQFVEEQTRTDSDIVCLSAMMTTTMLGMKTAIEKLKAKNPDVKIMIGGAPVSAEIAAKWGADGYAPDAPNALQEALNMIKGLRELESQG
ncbi:MAG: cobalamin-binding protein [Chloroflexi bacterium B3_Chlor]|nr:MAG: cobalamin-binding protein [Chloroflexi bacterium B3_Chlor]